jgi:hypothetical protein
MGGTKMLIRSLASTPADDTALTRATSSSALISAIQPIKVVLFNADIDEVDVDATLIELARLKQAGHHLFGCSAIDFSKQGLLTGENGTVEITDVTDMPDTLSLPEIHVAIRALGVPVFPYGALEEIEGEKLSAKFDKIFAAIVAQVPNSWDWMNVQGIWVDIQPTLNRKLENYSHIVEFKTRVDHQVVKVKENSFRGGSRTGSDIMAQGAYLKLRLEKIIYVEKDKFTVNFNYSGSHFKLLSSALNYIDNSVAKRFINLFAPFRLTTSNTQLLLPSSDNDSTQQLLLTAGDEQATDPQLAREQPARQASAPRAKSRVLAYFIATLLTIAVAVSSYLFLPLAIAAGITGLVGLTALTAVSVFSRNTLNTLPTTPEPSVVIEEPHVEEDRDLDSKDDASPVNRRTLRNLSRARHFADDENDDGQWASLSASDHSDNGCLIEEATAQEAETHTEEAAFKVEEEADDESYQHCSKP